ncbi:MAG TPA: selenocysteine-specific translation elongation factor [Candidatus Eisenbacteria bacterium]|nr:selenocysteine-specific translation elongation factor [Candidatus Eisenbacteria bacterium]
MTASPFVIGTAGHIDHGKTARVRRLTGIDTDRLKEERERGISIDLGFAHLALPSGRRVAIVDVPGHERFVKNMLAGATGIDVVLLVVAADEGVMPQTREHLAIVELLDVRRGVVALTKSDLVAPELAEAAGEEVAALLARGPLKDAPIVPVSSVTGAGVDALVAALDAAVASLPERDAGGAARLPVDRVFSIEGIGTVVTGTLWSGAIAAGDELELLPGAKPVRVRQVEVHDQPVPRAVAGQRTAVAIHGVNRQDVARGEWLVTPGRFLATSVVDVRLRLLESAGRTLEDRTRVRVHLGASETLARIVLVEGAPLEPGDVALVQLRLESPVLAIPGDRLVLRAYSPAVTIAGAVVLDAHAERRARLNDAARRRLEVFETGTLAERVALLAAEAEGAGVHPAEAALRFAVAPEAAVAAARAAAGLRALKNGRYLTEAAWTGTLERIAAAVARYAETHKLREGIGKGELKSLLARDVEGSVFDEALESLLAAKALALRGDRVALPDAAPVLSPDQAKAVAEIERKLQAGGYSVPELTELLKGLPPAVKPPELIRYLLESGRVVKVTPELLYPAGRWAEVEAKVRQYFSQNQELTMAAFKELFQVSRKYSVPLLEHLDRIGLTRRQGDVRLAGPRTRQP